MLNVMAIHLCREMTTQKAGLLVTLTDCRSFMVAPTQQVFTLKEITIAVQVAGAKGPHMLRLFLVDDGDKEKHLIDVPVEGMGETVPIWANSIIENFPVERPGVYRIRAKDETGNTRGETLLTVFPPTGAEA